MTAKRNAMYSRLRRIFPRRLAYKITVFVVR